MAHSINIISRTNGVGLDSDVSLLRQALEEAGFEVTMSHCRAKSKLASWLGLGKNKYDVNIYLERIFPVWNGSAKKNVLIPNQERFPQRHVSRLSKMDAVFCKSKHAEEIFSKQGCATKYISFTSKDLNDESQAVDYSKFFHLAGKSTLKGTETLVSLWEKHPEWPQLTIVQHESNAPESVPENVNLIAKYLPQEKLVELINTSGVHLCTSLSEGWGHYIVEAMSCKAVAVTTDAPPMNELIANDRGILVPSYKSVARHLGINFYVDSDALESQIESLLEMDEAEKTKLGENAHTWFHDNHTQFTKNVVNAVKDLISKA